MDARPVQSPNRLLASLPAADFDLLRPHLKQIDLVHKTVLFEAGSSLERVYFPHSGIISLVVALTGGETIETAMIGRDSLVGGSSAMDGKIAMNKAIVQLPGVASVLGVDRLQFTQEFLSQMLGVRRTSVSLVAGNLQQDRR